MELTSQFLIYILILLPFAFFGAIYLKNLIIQKLNTKKGKVQIMQVTKAGRLTNVGYGVPDADGHIRLGSGEKSKLYQYDRKLTFFNQFSTPTALYTPNYVQIDLEQGVSAGLVLKELGNIWASAYSTALASFKHNEKLDSLLKWIPLGLAALTLFAVWYFCKDIPIILEKLNSMSTVI